MNITSLLSILDFNSESLLYHSLSKLSILAALQKQNQKEFYIA